MNATIRLLDVRDSRIPTNTTQVIINVMNKAGRLTMIGNEPMCGAEFHKLLAEIISADTGKCLAVRSKNWLCTKSTCLKLVHRYSGICKLKLTDGKRWCKPALILSKKLLRLLDHDSATTILPMAYSIIRSQPIIQAISSPKAA